MFSEDAVKAAKATEDAHSGHFTGSIKGFISHIIFNEEQKPVYLRLEGGIWYMYEPTGWGLIEENATRVLEAQWLTYFGPEPDNKQQH